MRNETKVKSGTLVKLINNSTNDPMYQLELWEDYYFLRDPRSMKILNETWIKESDLCIVVGSDHTGLIITTPRGQTGWIGKDKMEVVK